MMAWLSALHGLITLLLAVPVGVLALQLWTAAFTRPKAGVSSAHAAPRPSVAVLMPAHNEAAGVAETIANVRAQLQPGDRLLVVADNCSDTTATIAREAGAEVAERFDAEHRGKGYALAHGVAQLASQPPEVVLIVDADCRLSEGSVDALVRHSAHTQRPVQALYLMRSPAGAGLMQRVSEFAWRIKNHARARGAAVWRMPCPLMGTGMAFPWRVIATAPLASGSIVEDMRLGADLSLHGHAPLFLEQALVTSEFPDNTAASDVQRKRWEHGHLGVITSFVPRLLLQTLRTGQPALLGQALDLSIPPLALFTLVVLGWAALSALLTAWGVMVASASLAWALAALLVASLLLAWKHFGRDLLAPHELASLPWYIVRKVPMYAAFLFKRETRWIRTQRRDKP